MKTSVSVSGERKRALRRNYLNPWKAAMHIALSRIPAGPRTLLQIAAEFHAALDDNDETKINWGTVNQFMRLHPNVQNWAPTVIMLAFPGTSPAAVVLLVDLLFEAAVAVEEQRDPGMFLSKFLEVARG